MAGIVDAGGGMLGAQARVQYAALARLRWQMFTNGLRSNKGALELGARTVSFVFYAVGGLAFGVGAGAAAFLPVSYTHLHRRRTSLCPPRHHGAGV